MAIYDAMTRIGTVLGSITAPYVPQIFILPPGHENFRPAEASGTFMAWINLVAVSEDTVDESGASYRKRYVVNVVGHIVDYSNSYDTTGSVLSAYGDAIFSKLYHNNLAAWNRTGIPAADIGVLTYDADSGADGDVVYTVRGQVTAEHQYP